MPRTTNLARLASIARAPFPQMRTRIAAHSVQGAARIAVAAMGILTTLVVVAPLGAQQAPTRTQPATPQPAATQPVTTVPAATVSSSPQSTARRDTSSLPFHDDQWGMDFGLSGPTTYRIGAVRFTSPTRAWILDGYINGQIARHQLDLAPGDSVPSGYPLDAIQQGGAVSLLVGRRAYRALGARAMRTVSLSVGGGFGYDEALADGERTARRLNSNARLQFGVGAHYRVTPSLALGATFGLFAGYTWSDTEGSTFTRQRSQYFNAGLGSSELTLSLFF
jgi:hypothetical protein